jgi:hypothetical protein
MQAVVDAMNLERWELWFLTATSVLSALSGAAGRLVRQRCEFVFEGVAMFSLMFSVFTLLTILLTRNVFLGGHEDLTDAIMFSIDYDLVIGWLGIALGRQLGTIIAAGRPSFAGKPIPREVAEQTLLDWLDERTGS